jgi:hypothetical protein
MLELSLEHPPRPRTSVFLAVLHVWTKVYLGAGLWSINRDPKGTRNLKSENGFAIWLRAVQKSHGQLLLVNTYQGHGRYRWLDCHNTLKETQYNNLNPGLNLKSKQIESDYNPLKRRQCQVV